MRLVTGSEDPPAATQGTTRLRKPRAGDAEARFALGQDAQLLRMFGTDPTTLPEWTREEALDWVIAVQNDAHGFVIEDAGDLAGKARLRTLDPLHRRAVLELTLVDATKLDQGLIRRAVALMLDYAFDTLDLHRVSLRCLETNKRALTCYESSGFRREGVEREAIYLGDMWHDVLLLAKLARDHRP